MPIPKGAWGILKEVARHLLRRPVVGLLAIARDARGQVLLIRRGDTGQWAPPGGTLEWGETLRATLTRELREEAGVEVLEAGALLGTYSDPARDMRFHAVTVVVGCTVGAPTQAPMNPMEIREVRFFAPDALPSPLSHGLDDVVRHALRGELTWE